MTKISPFLGFQQINRPPKETFSQLHPYPRLFILSQELYGGTLIILVFFLM